MVTVEADDGTYMATQDVTVTVTDVDEEIVGDTLLDTYDARTKSGDIDKEEVRAALTDYFNDVINKEQAREVLTLYFASPR